jgi:hypothetical protein
VFNQKLLAHFVQVLTIPADASQLAIFSHAGVAEFHQYPLAHFAQVIIKPSVPSQFAYLLQTVPVR